MLLQDFKHRLWHMALISFWNARVSHAKTLIRKYPVPNVPANAVVDREPMVLVPSKMRPNPPMQPTPLRVDKIVAFLKPGIGPGVFPIHQWRRG
jgi:hypothetical protein